MEIQSDQNPRIKNLSRLIHRSKERKSSKLFVVEGLQENKLALAGGYKPLNFFYVEDIFTEKELIKHFSSISYAISKKIFEKLAYREHSGGLLGIYEEKKTPINQLTMIDSSVFLLLEGIEKPGNLGAILRTADAAGVSGVILIDAKVDPYSPNVIRSSVGTIFTNHIVDTQKEAVVHWLQENKINLYATHLNEESQDLYQTEFQFPAAVLFGTESTGIHSSWIPQAKEIIKIPMAGKVDSLNVSNAVAITTYEIYRQLYYS